MHVLEVATPACAADDIGDEVVALNVETGIYFSIRGLGAALWRDLAAGHPAERLAALARDAAGSDAAILSFVEQVREHGLMRQSARPPADGEPESAALLRGGDHELVFEVYGDLQDLLLSDPIHDFDPVVGWPTPRSSS